MQSAVASRYAKALVDVVLAPHANLDSAAVVSQLKVADSLIAESSDLRNALLSPAVSPSRKHAVIGKLMGPMNLLPQVRNFLFVVIDHRRVHEFTSIVEAFQTLLDERLGFVRADVTSAHPLNDAQRSSLEAQLTRLAGKNAKLNFSTDPTLVAGVIARVGSTVYDGSVKGQLERLRMKLANG